MVERRSRRELKREEVLLAATTLAQRKGMDFTMRELADALHTWPNALYRFFGTKQALQADIIDRVMSAALTDRVLRRLQDDSVPWQTRVQEICGVIFDVSAEVPGLGRLLTQESMFESPGLLSLVFTIVEELAGLGFSRQRAGELVQIVAFYVLNMGELEAAQRAGRTTEGEFKEVQSAAGAVRGDHAIDALLSYDKRERMLSGLALFIAAAERELAER
ncbi:MAG: helix-turn-helix domain-containing protein [Pseudomonadota bacterium]